MWILVNNTLLGYGSKIFFILTIFGAFGCGDVPDRITLPDRPSIPEKPGDSDHTLVDDVKLRSSKVESDSSTRRAYFTLNYETEPRFDRTDDVGRVAHGFQIFIKLDGIIGGNKWDYIIRGGEIAVYGFIPVRRATPSSSDPSSGGWGEMVSVVPGVPGAQMGLIYKLENNQVTFSAPWEAIGASDGAFTYVLDTFYYGSLRKSKTEKIAP